MQFEIIEETNAPVVVNGETMFYRMFAESENVCRV